MMSRSFLSLPLLCLSSFCLLVSAVAGEAVLPNKKYDLVVIEATPGGIAMAVRAAREGGEVLLVNRTAHLGGILSSGLGVWDTLYEGRRSPVYDEVRQSIFDHYRSTYGDHSPQYKAALPGKSGHTNGRFEPRVAEKILTDLVAREKRIAVLKGYVPVAVEREGRLLRKVTLAPAAAGDSGRLQVEAHAFADCSYEGDLLPLAEVAFRSGRESRAEYGEPHAGRIYMRPSKTPPDTATAERAAKHDRLNLRRFTGFQQIVRPESTGEGDGNVQAFNYRTILTSDPANRLPVQKPAGYDPDSLRSLEFGSIVSPLPNNKIGWNRPQLVGPHQAYVNGNWHARQQVMDQHWNAAMGLLYFLQNDPSVPEERRQFFGRYGLARDEFADNGHRPYEIYVREARRLVGRYVIAQHDFSPANGANRTPVHADSIAFAEWYLDTHACTPGKVKDSLDEGKMMLHHETFPAQIPYRALLPVEVDNLLVPVCLSATHVAWGAIRLEPAWMQIGESAGYACTLARKQKITPAALDSRMLVRTLAASRSMVSFFNDVDVSLGDEAVMAAQYFATRGFFGSYDAALSGTLTEAEAGAWLAALAAPGQPSLPALSPAPAKDAPALTGAAWNDQIKRAGRVTSVPVSSQALTRADALVDLWRQETAR